MQLRISWASGFGDSDSGLPSWIVAQPDQRCVLRAELAQLDPGRLRLRLRARRRFWPESWRTLDVDPSTEGSGDSRTLCFSLHPEQLGLRRTSFATRVVELAVTLATADGGREERARARAYVMPARQHALARICRWLAAVPLFPLALAYASEELSGGILALCTAITLTLSVLFQEAMLTRVHRGLHDLTRGVVPILAAIALLILVQRSLLVRVENASNGPLQVGGLQLDRGSFALTWRWQAPSESTLKAGAAGWSRYAVDDVPPHAFAWHALFWPNSRVCCKPMHVDCQREPGPAGCGELPVCEDGRRPTSLSREGFVELGAACSVSRDVRKRISIEIVLGSDAAGQDAPPACAGEYELALAEERAYSGDAPARAEYAGSFAMLELPAEPPGVELLWTQLASSRGGVVSVAARMPNRAEQREGCRTMIPVRSGPFQVELRESGNALGTLRCAAVGTCPNGYAVSPAYLARTPSTFDGMQSYALDHGRSVWTYVGESFKAFVCRCSDEQQRPAQASLRLRRAPPESLRLEFDRDALPERIDIATGERDQRSILHCHGAEVAYEQATTSDPRASLFTVQPLSHPFARGDRDIVVTSGANDEWSSRWQWLEGGNQAWSCVPDDPGVALSVAIGDGRSYGYRRHGSGDGLALPDCYIHPANGAVKASRDAHADIDKSCWRDATSEYAQHVRRSHVCGRVLACPRP